LISEVVLLLEENRRTWIDDWAARNNNARTTLFFLGAGALVLGLLIAATVIRREWAYAARLKREIRERQDSESRFRDFAEVASDWFWEMDENLRFSFFSGQIFSILGLDPNTLIGKTRREMSAETIDDPKWLRHLEDLDAHRPFSDFQYNFQLSKDKTLSISISGKPVFDDHGNFSGYRGCGTNITARVEAERALWEVRENLDKEIQERTHQLRQEIEERKQIEVELGLAKERAEVANMTKSQFLANMSHELRSPLNAIIGFSDAINSKLFGPLGDPKYEEYIYNIRESGHHLLELINDILDLSVVEAGKLELSQDSVDIQKVIDTMVNMIRTQAIDKQLKLTFLIADDIPLLLADERRVKQVLINLATNALKFTPKGGEITTTAGTDHVGCVFVKVSDTGIGMDEQEIETAMSSFGQVRGTSTQTHDGTGLGLPLAKLLMTAHGGDLEITSVPGKGTTATIRFPRDLNISS
jgi:PAS domain S-box-containing protein